MNKISNNNKIEGFRLDSLEIHFGRTIKTGEFENCRADLKIGGVITTQKDISEVSSKLFQILDKQVTEQLNRVVNGSQNPTPQPSKSKNSDKTSKKKSVSELSDDGEKFATEKQLKAIYAIGYNNGLTKDEIVQQLKERFGTADIVNKVSRADVSDYIEEIQMVPVE